MIRATYLLRVRAAALLEYARLQGEPVTFGFVGSDNDGYRMIGKWCVGAGGKMVAKEVTRYFS